MELSKTMYSSDGDYYYISPSSQSSIEERRDNSLICSKRFHFYYIPEKGVSKSTKLFLKLLIRDSLKRGEKKIKNFNNA